MRLIGELFIIEEDHSAEGVVDCTISLNPNHVVYKGHFPGHPVTPGVVQLQMVHELLEWKLGTSIRLKTISQCKFLKVLNPDEHSLVRVTISYNQADGEIKIKAAAYAGTDEVIRLQSLYLLKHI